MRELLTWMAHAPAPFFGSPPPGAFGRGQKVKYHSIWITKSISKVFKPNFVYLLTNERYITNQMGFSFGRLGHAQGWDLGVLWGGWGSKSFFPEFQPDLVCALLTWMAHKPAQYFGSSSPGALGRGQKCNFLNMVMWHFKLKGMSSRPLYTEKILIYNKTGDLGMGSKGQLSLDFFESVGICDGAPSNVF